MKIKKRQQFMGSLNPQNGRGRGKDRGGFRYAHGMEDDSMAVPLAKSVFDSQRTEISQMQAVVRMYMSLQRERLEKAATGSAAPKVAAAAVNYTTVMACSGPSANYSRNKKRKEKRNNKKAVATEVSSDPGVDADGEDNLAETGRTKRAPRPSRVGREGKAAVGGGEGEVGQQRERMPSPARVNFLRFCAPSLIEIADDGKNNEGAAAAKEEEQKFSHFGESLLDMDVPPDGPKMEYVKTTASQAQDAEPGVVSETAEKQVAGPPSEDAVLPDPPRAPFVVDSGTEIYESGPDQLKASEGKVGMDAEHAYDDDDDMIDYESVEDEDALDLSWLAYPEIPATEEIFPKQEDPENWALPNEEAEKEPVAVNRIRGPWGSKHEYLRSHYMMMREDAVKPLRDSVEFMRSNPYARETELNDSSIGIYDKVHVTAVTYAPQGISIKIVFSLGRVEKRIIWEQSKRLVTGSLVALTPVDDMFNSKCYLAVVAGRSLKGLRENPPELDLYFGRDAEIQLDPFIEFVMVENRSGFFEAQKHTLVALQNMMGEPFPMSEHFVDLEKDIPPPDYLSEQPMTNVSSIFEMGSAPQRINALEKWPTEYETTMDHTQISALRRMLTKRLAIVQGPPGTGKTYVSVKAIEVMLRSMPDDAPPIIVTCQTNHALDQLLRHISKFESNFIRLGSRTKDVEVVKDRQIFPVRHGMALPGFVSQSFIRSYNALRDCTHKLMKILEPLTEGSATVMDAGELAKHGILTTEQVASLERANSDWVDSGKRFSYNPTAEPESLLGKWLGNALTKNPKSFECDAVFEFEDRDPEFEQVGEQEAENDIGEDKDDYEILSGPVTSVHIEHGAKERARLEDHECEKLLQHSSLYRIEPKFRGAVFAYMVKKLKEKVIGEFRLKAKEYNRLAHIRKTGAFERDVAVLKQQRIIGLTTTGFSKYRAMIVALQPRVVMIEEAAESLEAPIIAACVPSLQHLILVGDHKQLRPHTQVQKHEGDPVNMNVSLFERMVMNKIPFTVLRRQRRMRPEIRRVLRPLYEDALRDHDSVKDPNRYAPIPGMGGLHSYFATHSYPETQDSYRSSVNEWEAHMVSGLFEYLVLNGTPAEKITVITFYNGQRKKILSLLRKNPNISHEHARVSTVDSYQGEENDVIILSLVRSNDRGNIGFLSVDNRVCVAISRARSGFYIFGNALLLCCENPTWESVVQIMAGKAGEDPPDPPKRRLGFFLPLVCKNHGRKTFIQGPEDWEKYHGGCERKCNATLSCGHKCLLNCHPFSHDETPCQSRCNKPLPCGHPCSELCGQPVCVCTECVSMTMDSHDDDDDEEEFDGRADGGGGRRRVGLVRNHPDAKAKGLAEINMFQDDWDGAQPWAPEGDGTVAWNGGGAGGGRVLPPPPPRSGTPVWQVDQWDGSFEPYTWPDGGGVVGDGGDGEYVLGDDQDLGNEDEREGRGNVATLAEQVDLLGI